MNVSLEHYAKRLREWNESINLVGPETIQNLEARHIKDCAQLNQYLPKPTAGEVLQILDLGTGAGLPGLILAMSNPTAHITMVESDSRKCAFIRTIVHELGLANTTVKNERLEQLNATPSYDVITARAFAPLSRLLPQSRGFLRPQGRWLLLKGEAVDEELKVCETLFPMTTQRWPSIVSASDGSVGWVLEITPT